MQKSMKWAVASLVVAVIVIAMTSGVVRAEDLTLSSRFPADGTMPPEINCTFFADGYSSKINNWNLKFSGGRKPNAKDWAKYVTNATIAWEPLAGDVIVLDKFGDNPYGHVGVIEGAKRNKDGTYTLTVAEGWKRGTRAGVVNGKYDWHRHEWTVKPGKKMTARIKGGSLDITVLGFLRRK